VEEVQFYIGVTGLPGAGKGAFIDLLRPMLAERAIQTRYYSLSDVLRAEAGRRGLSITRHVLRDIANDLRQREGSGVLSLMVLRKIRDELAAQTAESEQTAIIIDSIRNPEEVTALRQQLGERFSLVGIEAPLEILVERIARRARYDEPDEFVEQKEAARRMILGEAGQNEPDHGHNINRCVAMADWRIDNSRSMDALAEETQRLVSAMVGG
jgi:dephospho-CoA kinase